jgi:hypothetical protein
MSGITRASFRASIRGAVSKNEHVGDTLGVFSKQDKDRSHAADGFRYALLVVVGPGRRECADALVQRPTA